MSCKVVNTVYSMLLAVICRVGQPCSMGSKSPALRYLQYVSLFRKQVSVGLYSDLRQTTPSLEIVSVSLVSVCFFRVFPVACTSVSVKTLHKTDNAMDEVPFENASNVVSRFLGISYTSEAIFPVSRDSIK